MKVGKYTFRSFPLPGHPERALLDVRLSVGPAGGHHAAWSTRATPAGTEATAHFWFKLFPRNSARAIFRSRRADGKAGQSDRSQGQLAPGPDLLTRFLNINGDLRKQNNQQLADLRLKTEEKILWNGPFIHWGKEEADFADVRNYVYNGKKWINRYTSDSTCRMSRNAPGAGGQRRTRGLGVGPGHLRQLHRGGPRLWAAIDLRAPAARST